MTVAAGPPASSSERGYFCSAAAAAVSIGLVFNGFNNQFGAALSCIINASLFAALILWRAPSIVSWRRIAPVAGLVGVASLWASGFLSGGADRLSFTPDLLEGGILGNAAGLLALVAGYIIARRYDCDAVLTWLLAFGCAILSFGLYLRQAGAGNDWDLWTATTSAGRFAGTLGNANVAAVFAGVLVVLALAKALAIEASPKATSLGRRQKAQLFSCWLAIVLAFGALMLSASRTTTIMCVAGVIALVGRHLLDPRHRDSRLLLVAGSLALLCLGAGVFELGLLEQRFGSIDSAFALRQTMWRHYTQIALASPLHGYGLGSFPSVNTYFLGDPALAQPLWSVNSAHNIALQLIIEGGVPYLALLSLAAAWIGAVVARGLSARPFSIEELGVLASLGIVFASACVDIVLDVPAMVTLTLFLAGLLWGRRTDPEHVGIAVPELAPANEKALIGD